LGSGFRLGLGLRWALGMQIGNWDWGLGISNWGLRLMIGIKYINALNWKRGIGIGTLAPPAYLHTILDGIFGV